MVEYLTYPFKTMRITQGYSGSTSHYPHTTGNPKDYPFDNGGRDSGRDPMYAPCDLVVKRIYGVGTGGTNTLWVESADMVMTPAGTDYVTMQITHSNDSDLSRLKTGQIIKKGDVVCYEGTDGASGNHIHLSVGFGHISGSGWTQNSNGKWVLTTTGRTLKPQQAFFLDYEFTNVVNTAGLSFRRIPAGRYAPGNYRVRANRIYVRTGPGKTYTRKGFDKFTANAQSQIRQLNNGKPATGYIRGVEFYASDLSYNAKDRYTWGRTPSGWVALNKCDKI